MLCFFGVIFPLLPVFRPLAIMAMPCRSFKSIQMQPYAFLHNTAVTAPPVFTIDFCAPIVLPQSFLNCSVPFLLPTQSQRRLQPLWRRQMRLVLINAPADRSHQAAAGRAPRQVSVSCPEGGLFAKSRLPLQISASLFLKAYSSLRPSVSALPRHLGIPSAVHSKPPPSCIERNLSPPFFREPPSSHNTPHHCTVKIH